MDLDEIRKAVGAATPGPWTWEDDRMLGGPHLDVIIETDAGVYPPETEDRTFIAGAREWTPYLLGRIGALEKERLDLLEKLRDLQEELAAERKR